MNQGQYLPSIDPVGSGGLQQKPFKSKNVKPDYYKNRRRANFANMFEVFDDDTRTLGQAGPPNAQDYDDSKRSIESDDNRTLGTIQVTEGTSHKFATEKKKNKGYLSEGKHAKFNFNKVIQSDGRQSIDQNYQSSVAGAKGLDSRIGSNQSAFRSPRGQSPSSKHNALEEVEKLMPSPEKKLRTAAHGSRQQSLKTVKQAAHNSVKSQASKDR